MASHSIRPTRPPLGPDGFAYKPFNADELEADYEAGRPTTIHVTDEPDAFDFNREDLASEREAWARVVAGFMASPFAEPSWPATFIALLPTDRVTAWAAEIEAADDALIVTPRVEWSDDGGWDAPEVISDEVVPVVIRLTRNRKANVATVVTDAEVSFCPIGADYEAADLTASALGGCELVFWGTDTSTPAAFDLAVAWPLGEYADDEDRFDVPHPDTGDRVRGGAWLWDKPEA